jgi:predicted PurR-regulated permease PerM
MESSEKVLPENPAVQRAREAWGRVATAVRSITPSALVRGLLWLAAATAVIWLITSTWPALLPFFIGGAVAYALLPLTNSLNRIMPRAFAVALALVVALIILGLIIYASVIILGRQTVFLLRVMPGQAEVNALISQLDESLVGVSPALRQTIVQTAQQLADRLANDVAAYYARLPEIILSGLFTLLNTLGFILGFLAIPAWLLLVLRDQQAGSRALRRVLPPRWLPDVMAVWRIFDRSFRAFIEGLLVMALFVTLFVYIGLLFLENIGAISVTFMLAAALFAGLMQLIPTIGPIIVVMVILLTRLTIYSTGEVLALLIVYLVVQQLLRLTVEPRVRRVVTDVHPALLIMVIVALSGFGFLWVFLAAPITAVVRDLFRYIYGRFGEPPRPAGLLPGETPPRRKKQPRSAQSAAAQARPIKENQPAAGRRRAAQESRYQASNDVDARASQYNPPPVRPDRPAPKQAAVTQVAATQVAASLAAPGEQTGPAVDEDI